MCGVDWYGCRIHSTNHDSGLRHPVGTFAPHLGPLRTLANAPEGIKLWLGQWHVDDRPPQALQAATDTATPKAQKHQCYLANDCRTCFWNDAPESLQTAELHGPAAAVRHIPMQRTVGAHERRVDTEPGERQLGLVLPCWTPVEGLLKALVQGGTP